MALEIKSLKTKMLKNI